MSEEKIREWVEDKLDEGVDEERIKNSLENTGHDPSILEEVKAPFNGKEVEEDPFEFSGNDSQVEEEEDDSAGGKSERLDLDFPGFLGGNLLSRLGLKHLAILIILVVVAGSGYLLQQSQVTEPEKQCVGVKMYSVTAEGGQTVAEVTTVKEARVVLEVFRNGEKIGETSKVMKGDGTIRVDAVGNQASFHGIGCPGTSADRSY
ncbi:MAG: hypothetical protein ABEJ56_01325 [Candidatus Nanohaloarchaea archaeon]